MFNQLHTFLDCNGPEWNVPTCVKLFKVNQNTYGTESDEESKKKKSKFAPLGLTRLRSKLAINNNKSTQVTVYAKSLWGCSFNTSSASKTKPLASYKNVFMSVLQDVNLGF